MDGGFAFCRSRGAASGPGFPGLCSWIVLVGAAIAAQRAGAQSGDIRGTLWTQCCGVEPCAARARVGNCFLDVGQGDAAFVRFPDGKTMVIDGGERSERFDYGDRVLVPFLRHMGVGKVDVVVVSHPHNDHIGRLVALLEQVEVEHFVDGGQSYYDSWTATRLRQLVAERGVRYHRVAAGDSLAGLGGVGGLVLHPNADYVDLSGPSAHGLINGSAALRRGRAFLSPSNSCGNSWERP